MEITSVIVAGLVIIAGFVITYYNQREQLQKKAGELINTAEGMYTDVTKAGGQRFEWVVDQLYSRLPACIKPFLTRERVKDVVQETFNFLEQFSYKQLDKVVVSLEDGGK